jgi:penicillin amidase
MGQDRLWQMDYLRRLGAGTLAEVMGPSLLESDRLHRTLGLRRVANTIVSGYDAPTRSAVQAFVGGVNLARDEAERNGLPFEFELLEYGPAPWTMDDSELVLRAFWWQLTGRFFFACGPEFAARALGEPALVEALLTPEGRGETIWPEGVPYPDGPRWGSARPAGSMPQAPGDTGSNNWVVGPGRSTTGAALLAGDPHVPLGLPSVWYEARVSGGGLDLCGAFAVGTPGAFYGRNPAVSWALTNNISSLRDLYVEVTDDFDPSRYRRPDGWHGIRERVEFIDVRNAPREELRIREVDHGPIVSELLPVYARTGETVSLRWVGHDPSTELAIMLAYVRAQTAAEFRAVLCDWACPTFNYVFADQSGEIGYQLTGKIPLRRRQAAGYRHGGDADDLWRGSIPFEGLPALSEPPRGWLGTANNPVATHDWPYPLSGFWPSDYRMQRLRQLWDAPGTVSPEAMVAGQMDVVSPRAQEWAGPMAGALRKAGIADPLLNELESWDCVFQVESRPACIFETFFLTWGRAALAWRLPGAMVGDLLMPAAGLMGRLLGGDVAGWFGGEDTRLAALRSAWDASLAWLEERQGPDRCTWHWGAVHTVTFSHPLGQTPVLRELLQRGPYPAMGTWNTLNNSPYPVDRPFEAVSGVSYRFLSDLAGATQGINSGGASGHPGSPHYADQIPLWLRGDYHLFGD